MGMKILSFRFPGVAGVSCAFTGREFGNVSLDLAARDTELSRWADTVQVRESIAGTLGVDGFAEVHQVHGVRTVFDPQAQSPALPSSIDADGMATTRPGLALMVKTADCQPILIAHEGGRHVMALHSGWRGNRQDYPRLAVLEFCERYGLEPAELWAVRGPSLGPTASEFTNFEEEWGEEYRRWFDAQTRTMDLWMLARDQLICAGLLPGRVLGLDLCTWENTEKLFSFRRFRKYGAQDGRQASFIWITGK
ncbi:MAG: laccase domain-containing protein [Mailhella sp.]|nr:laccase domain-containing protein [Mailhella sp.]